VSLDTALLEAAIRRDDPAAVRDLLREATDAERAACARALKPLLRGPEFPPETIRIVRPQDVAGLISSLARGEPPRDSGGPRAERRSENDQWREMANGRAFRLAVVGLAGGVAAAARALEDFEPIDWRWGNEVEMVAAVLADRSAEWLTELISRHLRLHGRFPFGIPAWPLARRLVRLGAIARPDVPEYTTLMPQGVWHTPEVPDGDTRPADYDLTAVLLADPGLLEEEVWRLFTVPDAAKALHDHDGRAGNWAELNGRRWQTWADGLAQLSERGHLDRGRLIDECLAAFTRDFDVNRVSWYATMLARLDPSLAEVAARAQQYFGLLGAGSKAAVTVAQQAARRLLEAGLLEPGPLLEASGPALLFPQKSIAMAQLKLIDKILGVAPATGPQAIAAVAAAFGHERQDIQDAALALIRKRGIPVGAPLGELRLRARDLSPALTVQAAALGLGPNVGPAAGQHAPGSAGGGPDPDFSRLEARIRVLPDARRHGLAAALDAARRGIVPGSASVEPSGGAALPAPVSDPDELVQLLAMLMEDARDPVAAERALAGAVRLSGLPPELRRRAAAPLLKRAAAVMNEHTPFAGHRITSDMALIAQGWGGGQVPATTSRGKDRSDWYEPGSVTVDSSGQALAMGGVFSARTWEAARLIGVGRGGQLLAEPETERAAITSASLLDRLWQLAGRADGPGMAGRHDRDVALLRLAPGADDSLWEAWSALDGTPASELQASYRVIQAPLEFEAVTGTPPGRSTRGYGDWNQMLLAKITGSVPTVPGCPTWQLLTSLADPVRDHGRLYAPAFDNRQYDTVVAGWALICPWQPEVAAAHLLRPLSDGLRPGPSPATAAITSLSHPGHPLGPVGHLALAAGIASAEADTRIAAAQLWSDACADGRLDPVLAADAIVTGVRGQALKLNRIADGLNHASHAELAACRIIETICRCVPALAAESAANLHLLLELAARLGAAAGVPAIPDTVRQLASRRSSTRLTATARQLLQAQDSPAPGHQAAAVQALTALVTRAEASAAP
jgi:uncharacterized protein DUF6493